MGPINGISNCTQFSGGRGSSVDRATRYELDDPGIESRGGGDFTHPFIPN